MGVDSFTKHNILKAYRAGMSYTTITAKHNVSRDYTRRLAKTRGLKSKYHLLQDWERCAIAGAYADGEKIASLAAEFKTDESNVRKIAKSFNIARRKVGRPTNGKTTRRQGDNALL